MQFVYPNTHW